MPAISLASLQLLLDTFELPGSCYVLGAGVSYPYVPLVEQLGASVESRLLRVGAFPAQPLEQDELGRRILDRSPAKNPFDADAMLRRELVKHHLSPGAVAAATIDVLGPTPPSVAPIQYGVFSLSRFRLILVNFNNDGFADKYCARHSIINMHGNSPSFERRERLNWESYIDALQHYPDLPGPIVAGLFLPGLETEHIASTKPFGAASVALSGGQRLAIVGYSFGGMDDIVFYRMVCEIIRRRRIPTLIVSPAATDLAMQVREVVHAPSVTGVNALWGPLAIAVAAPHVSRFKSCFPRRLCARCTLYRYSALLDSATTH